MAQGSGELYRLDEIEAQLINNYRRLNPLRQDTLLYFSDELVKNERQDEDLASSALPLNVVQIPNRK